MTVTEIEPQMRAAHICESRHVILARPDGEEILSQLSDRTRSSLMALPAVGWAPLKMDIEVTRAVNASIGSEGALAWAKTTTAAGFNKPYLKPFISGARGIFGQKILRGVGRIIPVALRGVYRDVGSFGFVQCGGESCCIEWIDLPQMVIDYPPYLDGVAAGLSAIFGLVDEAGVCKAQLDPAKACCLFTLRW